MILIHSKVSDSNLDYRFGSLKEVLKNRKKFFKTFGIHPKQVIEVNQIHGNNVILVEKVISSEVEADGMITGKKEIYLMLKLADCIPVALYDPKHQAIGLIHAGSKGLGKSIIKNAIEKMQKTFHLNPKDLIVKMGPSIGPCCYRKDIWQEAKNQLIKSGVLRDNIEKPRICTYESKDYFSHRRAEDTNTSEGRFVTILGL